MKMLGKFLFPCMILLLLSACLQHAESNSPSDDFDLSLPVEMSIEEAQVKIPFELKQPSVPFQVNQKSARILDTNGSYQAVELTYANTIEGLNLILMITNSTVDTPSKGKKIIKLTNGSQVWDQGDGQVSAIYWRQDGLTYSLITGKNNNLAPLYDEQVLIDIANSIK